MKTVTLKEWDWDAQAYVEREYPWSIVKGFVDDLRNKKQWIEDSTSQEVWRRFQRFQERLVDARNDAKVAEKCSATTAAGNPCKGKPGAGGLCMAHVKAAA